MAGLPPGEPVQHFFLDFGKRSGRVPGFAQALVKSSMKIAVGSSAMSHSVHEDIAGAAPWRRRGACQGCTFPRNHDPPKGGLASAERDQFRALQIQLLRASAARRSPSLSGSGITPEPQARRVYCAPVEQLAAAKHGVLRRTTLARGGYICGRRRERYPGIGEEESVGGQ